MSVNRRRGEVEAEFGGVRYRLCLTLGALAELEDAFGAGDLNALAERFASGRMSARDLIRILGAGLRGGGHKVSDEEAAALSAEDGVVGMAAVAAELLLATFGGPEDAGARP